MRSAILVYGGQSKLCGGQQNNIFSPIVAGAPVVEEEHFRAAGDEVMGGMQAAPVVVAVRLMKSPKKVMICGKIRL